MLHFEDGQSSEDIIAFLKNVAGTKDFPFLEQPEGAQQITIEAIHAASDAKEHSAQVANYAKAVFDVWSNHHTTIRTLIESNKS